jgi:LEA14-like dessication related protein
MQPLKRLRALSLVTAAVGLSGCASLLDAMNQTATGPQPTLTFKSVELTGVSLAGLTLDTVWRVENPSAFSITLASLEYALLVDGHQVLAGAPEQGLPIPAQGNADLHFPAIFKFEELGGVVETFLQKDTASWKARGAVGVSTPIGVVTLPLETSGTFEVPKPPQLAFSAPRVTNLSLTGATIEFPLVVTNRNSYGLPISSVTGELSIGNAAVGTLSTGDLGALQGKGTRTIPMPLTLDFLHAAGAAMEAARGGRAQVAFAARVQSGSLALPINTSQLLDFVK